MMSVHILRISYRLCDDIHVVSEVVDGMASILLRTYYTTIMYVAISVIER